MKTTLTDADRKIVWEIVTARLIEHRRHSLEELFFEALDEYARLKAQFESSDPFVFAIGATRWRVRSLPDGSLEMTGDENPSARR